MATIESSGGIKQEKNKIGVTILRLKTFKKICENYLKRYVTLHVLNLTLTWPTSFELGHLLIAYDMLIC